MPGLVCCKRSRLFTSSPDPTSNSTASETSATTNTLLHRRGTAPTDCRVLFNDSFKSSLETDRAPTKPNPTATSEIASPTNTNTRASILTSCALGTIDGPSASSRSTPQFTNTSPDAAANTASTRPSTSNCLTIFQRLAPSAARIASSLCRLAERINNRFATFAHAISSSNPTANSSTSSARRLPPTISSCKGVTVICHPPSSPFGPR